MTPAQRSRCMSKIRSKDTKPEIRIRKLLHSLGYRFRLHRRDLPGKPDLAFPSCRKALFVHGCFWHQHFGCKDASVPKSRLEYWAEKFRGNVARDLRSQKLLLDAGWEVLVIWECETSKPDALTQRLVAFLGPSGRAVDAISLKPAGRRRGFAEVCEKPSCQSSNVEDGAVPYSIVKGGSPDGSIGRPISSGQR
ncbi:very short patch repair endonuclease [Methylobacterium sp. Leaf91]|uniref:very short patch repair endonuclease n=1 Tax=Methylobacterium sp. Leaf91 TaxID=1736247 RepID=UPI0032985717